MWSLLLALLTLLNPSDINQGGYTRSPLFDYKIIFGLHLEPIEVIILVFAPLVFVAHRGKVLRQLGGVRLMSALGCIFIMAVFTGFLRLGRIAGMAELKALTITFTFMFLAVEVYEHYPRSILMIPSTMVILRSTHELVKLFVNPYVDPSLGGVTYMSVAAMFYTTLAVVAVILCKEYRRSYIVVGAAILGTLAILASSSRSSMLYLVLSAMFAFAFKAAQFARKRTTPIYAHALVLVLIAVAVLFGGGGLSQHSSLFREFAFWQGDTETVRVGSNMAHLDDIVRGVMLVGQAPLFGQGFGGALPVFGFAVFDGLIHNELLHFWVIMGTGGLLIWLFLFVVLPIRLLRSLSTWKRGERLRHPAALIAFLTLPYALTRATVHPPFYFDTEGIWLVANMFALEALALRAYAE
jgi:O-antigen ligase